MRAPSPEVGRKKEEEMIRYEEAKAYLLGRLKNELPENLHYHGYHHTLDVCEATDRIAKAEGLSGEEYLLVMTAALYHDAGHMFTYLQHEEAGAKLAKETLPQYGYSPRQIELIDEMIMATRVPHEVRNHYDKIMCDADLDYLGRPDYHSISETLRRELEDARGMHMTEREWVEMQINFLKGHEYFTDSARQMRLEQKQERLAELEGMLTQLSK